MSTPPSKLDDIFPQLYAELRHIAHRHRQRLSPSDTLSTTAIVHEAYIRLKEAGRLTPSDRLHFLALSARAMRFVLVDYARRCSAEKRGGRDVRPQPLLEEEPPLAMQNVESTLALHEALDRLSQQSARMGCVVECRFFGGMTESEIAEILGLSERTVRDIWQRARIWLTRELSRSDH